MIGLFISVRKSNKREHTLTPSLIFKGIIILLILTILASLTSGMFFLVRDRGESTRTVKSLTVRITLSIILFVLLIIGFASGLIQPHGLPQVQTEKAPP